MTVPTQQPNILLVMVDQLAAPALAIHGHKVTRTPHIDAFARDAVIFDSAYCNFPICAPSRFSMLSGKLPHSIAAWDNASEFPAAMLCGSLPLNIENLEGAQIGKLQ